MKIGIHALAAFESPRTGVEEYAFQLIANILSLEESRSHQFSLYSPKVPQSFGGLFDSGNKRESTVTGPEHVEVKKLRWPFMWTQLRLSWEMLVNTPDVLFIPAHVLPAIHPSRSVVTVQGLEFEYHPDCYSSRHRKYLRWATRHSIRSAQKIIVPSFNTKSDIVNFYGGDADKIEVIYHGIEKVRDEGNADKNKREGKKNLSFGETEDILPSEKYILFIGRIEPKKNIGKLVEAFEILRDGYGVNHRLILVGPPGFQYTEIANRISSSSANEHIVLQGYVTPEQKRMFLRNADVFVLPSLYEGFGFPILEAQQAGIPTITSRVSSMPEVAGEGALLVDPSNSEELAEAMFEIIDDTETRKRLVAKGHENVQGFQWEDSARKTLQILTQLD